jgi:hypothetical protein
LDLGVPELEELSREDLVALVRAQAERIAELTGANEQLAEKLGRLEHLLSRNSGNSSMPPSQDDEPGRRPPKRKAAGGSKRLRGKQPGAPGSNLAWRQVPDERADRFPTGLCGCGADLAGGRDLGVVDRYQQHEVPLVAVKVTQYDQYAVVCGCGRVHTAARPTRARSGPVGYGPNLQALCVYLLVVQFLPVGRVVGVLESVTGAAPSAGFVHGMLARAAQLLDECDKRIAALLTLAYVVCADETPLRVGPAPAKKYLLVACTQMYTHYMLGGRDLETFKAMVLKDLAGGSVIVHDRYQNYDAAPFAHLLHQLCTAHLLRGLEGVAELYPDEVWPTQIAEALRALIHEANAARAAGAEAIDAGVKRGAGLAVPSGGAGRAVRYQQPRQSAWSAKGAACTGGPARPARRRAALRYRSAGAGHLEPGRTRPAARQDPAEGLRAADQRTAHPRPVQDPRLSVHRSQARPQPDDRLARRDPRSSWMPGLPAST